jgi:flagellar hook protein FlgE
MFTAISGLKQHQTMLDVTANDIANVNTIGYKSSRVTFEDTLTQMQRGAAGANANTGGSNAAQVGLGVGLGSIDNLMTGGAVQTTGNPLDVAIQGDGFFQVAEGAPTAANPNLTPTTYTRAGNFSINSEGYLTTQSGQYVTGYAMPGGTTDVAISIPPGATGVAIDQSGGEQLGTPSAEFGQTTSGSVEMSNVDLAQEFTNMISAQRGFQANTRVISAADQMLQDLVQLGR